MWEKRVNEKHHCSRAGLRLNCRVFVSGFSPRGPRKEISPVLIRTLSSWENNLLLAQSVHQTICASEKTVLFLSLFFIQSSQFLPRSTAPGVTALGGHTLPCLRTLPKAARSTFGTSGKRTQRVDHHWTILMTSVLYAMHNSGSLK